MINACSSQPRQQQIALWSSTFAFAVCFAVWTIFSIIGIPIKAALGLNDAQFGLLVATPILTGSLSRLALGIWAEQIGGRVVFTAVMLCAASAVFLLTAMSSYAGYLLAALLLGLSGGSFTVGIAYVSRWFPKEKQGTVLGIFGAGNVGAALTIFFAPMVMAGNGWQFVAQVWGATLAVTGVVFFLITKDDPAHAARKATGARAPSFRQQIQPLRNMQVWRFALYYFFVFGAFVALALWLPHYLVEQYQLPLVTAGLLASAYSIPASLFRIVGGWLSDRIGARKVMYWSFGVSAVVTFLLSYPTTTYVVAGIDGPIEFTLAMRLVPFTVLVFVLGFFMSMGTAAVYKHIPAYYPGHVGAVGGMVGMIGGLGGFVLPITFGVLNDWIGIRTSCFMLLFVIASVMITWMHFAIRRMEQRNFPEVLSQTDLPEIMAAAEQAR